MEPEDLRTMLGPEYKLSWPAMCELATAMNSLIQTLMEVAAVECDVRWRQRLRAIEPEVGSNEWRALRAN